EDLTNILLTAKSEKELVKKLKVLCLQKGWYNVKNNLEYIKGLISIYKEKRKESPEWK
ncbi:16402_t:CDS:1, partial [Dentiscutata erythropus]